MTHLKTIQIQVPPPLQSDSIHPCTTDPCHHQVLPPNIWEDTGSRVGQIQIQINFTTSTRISCFNLDQIFQNQLLKDVKSSTFTYLQIALISVNLFWCDSYSAEIHNGMAVWLYMPSSSI